MGKYQEAITCFNHALEYEPTNEDVKKSKAEAEKKAGSLQILK